MPCCCPSFSVPSAPHRKTGQQPPWAIVRAHVTSPSMHFPKLGPPVAVDASCYPNGLALYTQHTTPVASSFKAIGAFHNRAANAFLVVVHSIAFVHTLGTITSFQRPSKEAPSPKEWDPPRRLLPSIASWLVVGAGGTMSRDSEISHSPSPRKPLDGTKRDTIQNLDMVRLTRRYWPSRHFHYGHPEPTRLPTYVTC